ncbi:hypothetical protein AB0L40_05540 [Patulibacter sp. NPDC049589]|uniref:hypothetical protein n=1 Tax=Patulibacter sp. NPDC049589 TaxID=3154731 RepID=UPI00343DF315
MPHPRRRIRLISTAAVLVALAGVTITGGDRPAVARAAAVAKPAPNRLLHGPQVYRLRPTHARYGDYGRTTYAYAVVFMLTRVHFASTFAEDEGAARITGEYSVGGAPIYENAQDLLYAKRYRPQHCVVLYVDPGQNSARELRRLDRVRIGQRLPVTLRPLLSNSAHYQYGSTYHRRPVLRQGDDYRLTEPGVQRQLRAIDCQRRGG